MSLVSYIFTRFPTQRSPRCRWGESAGSVSIGLHLVANGGNTEGLFRGAIMESGFPSHHSDITAGQSDYDALVEQAGCQGSADTLECLRQAPLDKLQVAINNSPSFFGSQVYKPDCTYPTKW